MTSCFVRVDQLTASLPFSRMEINDGMINFVQGGNILPIRALDSIIGSIDRQ